MNIGNMKWSSHHWDRQRITHRWINQAEVFSSLVNIILRNESFIRFQFFQRKKEILSMNIEILFFIFYHSNISRENHLIIRWTNEYSLRPKQFSIDYQQTGKRIKRRCSIYGHMNQSIVYLHREICSFSFFGENIYTYKLT